MNKFALFVGAVFAFIVPIGIVVCMNLDQLSGEANDRPDPTGKLVYYYSPS